MFHLVLLHLLWVLSSACLSLLSLVCELVSVCPSWSRSPKVPWPCCSLLLSWVCGARCYLSFWSRSAGICCGGLLLLHFYVLSKLPAIMMFPICCSRIYMFPVCLGILLLPCYCGFGSWSIAYSSGLCVEHTIYLVLFCSGPVPLLMSVRYGCKPLFCIFYCWF